MTHGHWAFLGVIALFFGLILCFSLFALPGSRSYRLAGRLFWGGLFLLLGSMILPLRLNPLSLAAAAGLGVPGVGLMLMLHLI